MPKCPIVAPNTLSQPVAKLKGVLGLLPIDGILNKRFFRKFRGKETIHEQLFLVSAWHTGSLEEAKARSLG